MFNSSLSTTNGRLGGLEWGSEIQGVPGSNNPFHMELSGIQTTN